MQAPVQCDDQIAQLLVPPHPPEALLRAAWKYHDNCHRGVVVGSLLGAANDVPAKWTESKSVRVR